MHAHAHATDRLEAFAILRIRLGFARVVPNVEAFAAAFHARLFERVPAMRALFADDASRRCATLKRTLIVLMTNLNRPTELTSLLAALGSQHRWQEITPAQCTIVGESFIDTLAEHLGDRFTQDDRAAWTALLRHVTTLVTADAARTAAAA